MAPVAPKNGNGMLSKVLAGGLLLFLAWLGYSVIQIQISLGSIETNIESLLETRRDQTRDQRQNTGTRLNNLEQAK